MGFKATAQDTVSYRNLPAYVGRKVTLIMPVFGFDMRREYIYLYLGDCYPRQKLTVIVKRNNGKKRIRLNKDIILGQVIASLKGFITTYDGEPDTTKNYGDDDVKKEFEKDRPVEIMAFHQAATMRYIYEPRKEPIDLRGKLVMFITEQKQIGATYEIPQQSSRNFNFPYITGDDLPEN